MPAVLLGSSARGNSPRIDAAHLEEGDAVGDALVALQPHRLVEGDGAVEIVDADRDDRDARFHRYSPVHFGIALVDEGADAFLGVARQHVLDHHLARHSR